MPNKSQTVGVSGISARVRVERLRRERDHLRHINKEMAGELIKLRAALERIAASTCCDKGQEAALAAREVLGVRSLPTVRQVAPSDSPPTVMEEGTLISNQLTPRRSVAGLLRAGARPILALALLPVVLWRRVPGFYRWSLLGAGVIGGICAWGAWRQYGISAESEQLYAIIAVWGVCYVAYWWFSRRRAQAAGALAPRAARRRSHRRDHIAGIFAATAIWVIILFVAVLGLAVYRAVVALRP